MLEQGKSSRGARRAGVYCCRERAGVGGLEGDLQERSVAAGAREGV